MTFDVTYKGEGYGPMPTIEPVGVSAADAQLTVQKIISSELLLSSQHIVSLFDALNTGIAVADMDGNTLTMNPLALKMYGFQSLAEARQNVLYAARNFFPYDATGRLLPPQERPMARALRGETIAHLELRVVHELTGDSWYGDFSAMPVYENGRQILAIVAVQDFTERVRAEAKEHWLTTENTRLYREAVQASSIRDDFLSLAGHELKTPIVGIRLFAQLLGDKLDKRDNLDAEAVCQTIRALDEESAKLLQLVNRLLDATRIDREQIRLDRQRVDMVRLTHKVAAALRRTTQDGAHLISVAAPESLMAYVDPARVEQVITNLLDNAIKYSPFGGAIEVELTLLDEQIIRFTVTDHGIGVAPEHRDHIFVRFYQGHAHTNFGGLGLGLYISQEIVTLHGGQIKAEFPDEGGTRLIVSLPVQYEHT